ncbi:MAG: Ig-like domain-containing protein [Candidatus Dojkabacteria bacterium]|nr:Ig-like domain-containing protein [Candidatus Dojkabacteria bacterium]MDQ7020280.1 Ig-like domain-containing protein [Candidatus Dojkabacteria bacterium]
MRKITTITALLLVSLISLGLMIPSVDAASFALSPANGALERACNKTVVININATGASSNAAEILLSYDPAQIKVIDSYPGTPGTQVLTGNAFQTYFFNEVNPVTGRIKIAAFSVLNDLTGPATFATIEFTSLVSSTNASFTIIEDEGGYEETIIADSATNNNILTSVSGASYNFIDGPCVADTQAPTVSFQDPTSGAANVALNSNVTIRIKDNQSGVDLDSLTFVIDGINYKVGNAAVSYTGNSLDYIFTINPNVNFPEGQLATVVVTGSDFSGNNFNRQMVFNAPVPEPPEPEIIIETITETITNTITNTVIEKEEVEVIKEVCDELIDKDPEPDISDIICEGTDVVTGGENVGDAIKVLNNFSSSESIVTDFLDNTPLNDTIVEDFFTELGSSGTIAFTSGFLILMGLLQALGVLGLPLSIASIILGKRIEKPWGVVTDGLSGRPVAFAVCALFTSGSQNKVDQVVSDLDGRYGFKTTRGDYRLEIKQSNYKVFIKEISIDESSQFGMDIALIPAGSHLDSAPDMGRKLKLNLKKAYNTLSKYLFVIGFIFSIISTIFAFNLLNLAILILYILATVTYIKFSGFNSSKSSSIINSENNLRVPYAQIKIFDLNNWELIDTQVANYNGQFDFYGEPGEYGLLVTARGYNFPSKDNKLPVISGELVQMIKTNLSNGKNDLDLFVDPK